MSTISKKLFKVAKSELQEAIAEEIIQLFIDGILQSAVDPSMLSLFSTLPRLVVKIKRIIDEHSESKKKQSE